MARQSRKKSVKTVIAAPRAVRTDKIKNNRVFIGGMPRTLGMKLVSVTRKKVIADMAVKDMHRNWNGRVNGGAIMSFADATGAAGASANNPPGNRGGTLESKTNFFAAGVGPVLRAVSVPLHIGRTTSVWQTTVTNSGDGKTVAIVTQTQMSLPARVAAKSEGE